MKMEHQSSTSSCNIILCHLLVLFGAVFMLNVTSAPAYAAAQKSAMSVEVTANGVSKSGSEVQALEAARRSAMYKVLSHMIPPSKDPKSDFVRVLEQYPRFVKDKKIHKKERRPDGSFLIILDAIVDVQGIEDSFSAGVSRKQNSIKNEDMRAAFVVRAVPFSENVNRGRYDDIIRSAFNNNFQKLGFYTDNPDDMTIAMDSAQNYPLSMYNQAMMSALDTHGILLMYAIIGEIRITELRQDYRGAYGKAQVSLIAVDAMNNKQIIGRFDEDYIGQGVNLSDAEELTLRKAAIDASEKIARITLDNWNRRR